MKTPITGQIWIWRRRLHLCADLCYLLVRPTSLPGPVEPLLPNPVVRCDGQWVASGQQCWGWSPPYWCLEVRRHEWLEQYLVGQQP